MRHFDANRNSRLARLFEIGMGRFSDWNELDWEGILNHQLRSPLLEELKPDAIQISHLGLDSGSYHGSPLNTFDDLLNHPSPPLPLLKLAKDFAKSADTRLDQPLPSAVATALCFLVMAAAITRHQNTISTLGVSEVENGLKWVTRQSWIEPRLRRLASNAMSELNQCN